MASCNCSARYMAVGYAHAASCALSPPYDPAGLKTVSETLADYSATYCFGCFAKNPASNHKCAGLSAFGKLTGKLTTATSTRTPLSEYTEVDLQDELVKRGGSKYVTITADLFSELVGKRVQSSKPASKPAPRYQPHPEWCIDSPESYRSDWD